MLAGSLDKKKERKKKRRRRRAVGAAVSFFSAALNGGKNLDQISRIHPSGLIGGGTLRVITRPSFRLPHRN